MSLSWTPFLNDFFSCLLLALLFSCHSLARVSSLLLGNALFTRCGSALLSFITSFWISSFFALSSTILFHRPIFWLLVIFSGIIQSGPVCPNCWLQLELCSLHGVAAPPHALPRAARPVHAHHALCVSRARLLWVVTPFQATTTLLNCFVFLLFQLHLVVVYSAVLADSTSGTSDTTAWSSVHGRCSRSTVEVLYNNVVCCLSPLSFGLWDSTTAWFLRSSTPPAWLLFAVRPPVSHLLLLLHCCCAVAIHAKQSLFVSCTRASPRL